MDAAAAVRERNLTGIARPAPNRAQRESFTNHQGRLRWRIRPTEVHMNAKSMSVWIAALALGLGSDVAAAGNGTPFVAASHNDVAALDAAKVVTSIQSDVCL